jgi:hypothetical protein
LAILNKSEKIYKLKIFGALLLAAQIIFLIYVAFIFLKKGYLPAPFFYDPFDTFMDFFNTNYWANMPGRYQEWKSIYPIFTFFLAQWITPDSCINAASPLALRDCSANSVWFLLASYLSGAIACAVLVIRQINIAGLKRAAAFLLITTMVFLSLPGLFALERGNYILVAFLFLALSECCGRNWKGALFLALAINIKQYLLLLWLVPLLRRRYGYLMTCVLFSFCINLIAMIFVPEQHYFMLFGNMLGFSQEEYPSYFEKMWYAISFSAWAGALQFSAYIGHSLSPIVLKTGKFAVYSMRWISVGLALVSFFVQSRRASEISWELSSLLTLLALLVVTGSPGGYALILLLPYLLVILARQELLPPLILIFILYCPLDITLGPHYWERRVDYLSGRNVSDYAGLTLGSYLRPGALVLLMTYLIFEISGWKSNKNKLGNINVRLD